jgi:hypothetical protein
LENSLLRFILLSERYHKSLSLEIAERLFSEESIERAKISMPELFGQKGFAGRCPRQESLEMKKISDKKFKLGSKRLNLLKYFPWIRFVGITGSVAFESARCGDDIDVIIATAPNRLWIVRPFVNLIYSLLRWRRRVSGKNNKNKLCFNLWVDGDNLSLIEELGDDSRADVEHFIRALEIVMIKPVDIKELFPKLRFNEIIIKNSEIKNYFPKVFKKAKFACGQAKPARDKSDSARAKAKSTCGQAKSARHKSDSESSQLPILNFIFKSLNLVAMKMQIAYMKVLGHCLDGTEISKGKAKFSPDKNWQKREKLLRDIVEEYDL